MELIHVSGNTDCLLGKTAIGVYRIDDTRCILFDNGYSKEYDELVGSLKDAGLTPAGLIVSQCTKSFERITGQPGIRCMVVLTR